MASNVRYTWERRLSEAGVDAIKHRLDYFSKADRDFVDLGIDLRCELIENDKPTVPFFVQAKGTEHFKKDNWSKGIKKSTIIYWLMSQFPVYLIVYDGKKHCCYWMSIEDCRQSLFQKLAERNTKKTISLKLDRSHILRLGKNRNSGFIEKIKDDRRSIQQFWGYPQFKGNGYVKKIPPPPRTEWEMRGAKEGIRAGLYSIIQHDMKKGDTENALICCRFLRDFDKSHYNHFVWLGLLARSIGNLEEAKENLTEGLEILERDPRFPKKKIAQTIRKELKTTEMMLRKKKGET